MAQIQQKEQTEKVFRSMAEFREHFFPISHQKELERKRSQDPKSFGIGLVQELLEGVKQQLRKRDSSNLM